MRQATSSNDAKRLLFIKELMDGMGPFDFHDMAAIKARAAGREEPNDDDYLAAIRASIDGMMAA
jgi:hypothetical protein